MIWSSPGSILENQTSGRLENIKGGVMSHNSVGRRVIGLLVKEVRQYPGELIRVKSPKDKDTQKY